jgi:hypothetical protein
LDSAVFEVLRLRSGQLEKGAGNPVGRVATESMLGLVA